MNRNRLMLFIVAVMFCSASSATKLDEFTQKTDLFMKKFVQNGKVNYQAIKSNQAGIKYLIEMAASMPLATTPNGRTEAFYINAYNLAVIYDIVRVYPVKSPRSIPGFFDRKRHEIGKQYFTLEELEEKLVKDYKDPRVHFALGRGAKGSMLISGSYKTATLDAQLTKVTSKALNAPSYVKVTGTMVSLCDIFKWNRADYGADDAQLIAWLNTYRKTALPAGATFAVEYMKFNWYLNRI